MLEAAIHKEASAALNRLQNKHADLKKQIDNCYGYAVFPYVGRAGVVLGGAYGQGEVYESGKPVGFATLSQITVGVQVGGQTFTEVLIFHNKKSLDDFKIRGKVGFSANASAVMIKAAATATSKVSDVSTRAYSIGGMLLEASLGGSKFMFIPPLANSPKVPEKPNENQPEKNKHQNHSQQQQSVSDRSDQNDPPKTKSGGVADWTKEQLGKLPGIGKLIPHNGKSKLPFVDKIKKTASAAEKEISTNKTLKKDVEAALITVEEKHPKFKKAIDQSYGYAVFPAVGRASLVLGGAYGKGMVFEQGKLIGYSAIIQVTIGVQVGGETFSAFVLFPDKGALDRFRNGKVNFAANAAAVIVKAGAEATTKYQSDKVYFFSEGGLLIDAAIGGQKFVFRGAALTKNQEIQQK